MIGPGITTIVWLLGVAGALLVFGFAMPAWRNRGLGYLVLVALLVAGWSITHDQVTLGAHGVPAMACAGGALVLDRLSGALCMLSLLPAFAGIAMLHDLPAREGARSSERLACLLIATAGACVTAGAGDAASLWLGIEMVWLPLTVLAASLEPTARSVRTSLRMMLVGVAGSCTLLLGLTLLVGLAGDTRIVSIVDSLRTAGATNAVSSDPIALMVPALLVIAGLAAKLGAFPMHLFAGDTLEGAPAAIAPVAATLPFVAATAALLRLLHPILATAEGPVVLLPGVSADATTPWTGLLAIAAAASMLIGGLLALARPSVARLLAAFGIIHGGMVLMGLSLAPSELAIQGLMATLCAFVPAMLAALLIVSSVGARARSLDDGLSGLARTSPLATTALLVALAGLIGLPPLAGCFGRWLLFGAAVETRAGWLAITAIVAHLMLLHPVARLARTSWRAPPADRAPGSIPSPVVAVAIVMAGVLTFASFLLQPLAEQISLLTPALPGIR